MSKPSGKDALIEQDNEYEFLLFALQYNYNNIKNDTIQSLLSKIPNSIYADRATSSFYKRAMLPLKHIEEKKGGSRQPKGIKTRTKSKKPIIKVQTKKQAKKFIAEFIHDAEGNFYTILDDKVVTHKEIDFFKRELKDYKTYNQLTSKEKYTYIRFIIFYLDELYTNLFCLEGQIPYEDGKEQFEEELYNDFLYMYFQIQNIQEYFSSNINLIYKMYYENRYKWTEFYIRGIDIKYIRLKNLGKFKDIYDRISSFLKEVKSTKIKMLKKIDHKSNILKRHSLYVNTSMSNTKKRKRTNSL